MEEAPPRKRRWFCHYGQARGGGGGGGGGGSPAWYKTEPCYFESKGWCVYGRGCYFRHSKEDDPSSGAGWQGPGSNWESSDGWNGNATWWSSGGEKTYVKVPCALFQLGCCWFDRNCYYAHVPADRERNVKVRLCLDFWKAGICDRSNCPDAHGREELGTPHVFQGMPGYKACLCTYFVIDGAECTDELCFDAHGELELRRLPLAVPRSLAGESFEYSDAHVHLDHVLLSRKYGTYWFYKYQRCKREKCIFGSGCMFVHDESERQERELDCSDLRALASEMQSLPGSFEGCVHNCCDLQDLDSALKLVEWGREVLGGKVYVSFGVHPTSFEQFTPAAEAKLKEAVQACGDQCVAWGECGLDYYRRATDVEEDPALRSRMKEVFARQAHIAIRRGLPLVVHSRDAEEDTLEVLRRVVPHTHPIHLHSFMGSIATMQEFLQRFPSGCVGIAGAVTYSGSDYAGGLVDIVRALPLDRMLLETDGPYMAPMPYRGEESHPGHIPWIAEGVAQVKDVSVGEVLAVTHANFRRLYRL